MQDHLLLETKKFQVVRRTRTTDDGQERTRDVIRHPGAVVLLPVLDDGRIVLIRNYRVSVGEWLIELPAGTVDPGEAPEATAHRELAEETGYRAASLEFLARFTASPGVVDEWLHLFLATGLQSGPTDLQADEDIQLHLVSWDEAMGLIQRGEIHDAKTMAGLLYFGAFRRNRP